MFDNIPSDVLFAGILEEASQQSSEPFGSK